MMANPWDNDPVVQPAPGQAAPVGSALAQGVATAAAMPWDKDPVVAENPHGTFMSDYVNPVINRMGTQFIKGFTGLAGAPHAAADLLTQGGNIIQRQFTGKDLPPEQLQALRVGVGAAFPGGNAPSADFYNKQIFNNRNDLFAVPEVNGQTGAGKVLDAALQAVPAAALIGPAAAKGIVGWPTALVPSVSGGVGQELAGQATEGSKWQPLARFAGGVVGGGLGALGQSVVSAGYRGVQNMRGKVDPTETANKLFIKGMERDKLTPEQIQANLEKLGPDATIADAGGENVQGILRPATNLPGPGRDAATKFLTERKLDEGNRVNAAIGKNVSDQPYNATLDKIVQDRANAANKLYQDAGVPNDPAQFPTAPVLQSPAVKTLIDSSSDIQKAIKAARQLPQYKDLPDTSIVLLDKAYKHIGGMVDEAVRSGNGVRARDLGQLKDMLRESITAENPQYGAALAKFAADSTLKDAIEAGRKAFTGKVDAADLAKMYENMQPDERALFRAGVAQNLQDTAGRSSNSPALRVLGGPTMQAKLKAVLGEDYQPFADQMNTSIAFNKTYNGQLSGSRTAPLAADMADSGDQISTAMHAGKSLAMGRVGNALWQFVGPKLIDGTMRKLTEGRNEAVNAKLVEMLLNPDSAANKSLLGGTNSIMNQRLAQILADQARRQGMAMGAATGPALGAEAGQR